MNFANGKRFRIERSVDPFWRSSSEPIPNYAVLCPKPPNRFRNSPYRP